MTVTNNGNGRRLLTQQSVNGAVKSICEIMRRSNCAGALQYVPELTWILFLRILDEKEMQEEMEAQAVGAAFTPSLEAPYRWRDWAAPEGPKRLALQNGSLGAVKAFVNNDLIPHLKRLRNRPNATPRQKVISEIMSGVERVRIDTERNFLDVVDKVHAISQDDIDPTHVFALSQVYEGLLLKMGEKGNDGGQFFTPREVIRAMVRVVAPKVGDRVYDPCCGTGGFLAQAHEYMRDQLGDEATPDQVDALAHTTFFGREKENLIYPIALANLILHGIDEPHIWHGNTLTGSEVYGGLFEDASEAYEVILTNPPFGGKEGKEAQTHFPFKTSATQVLFLQHVIASLKRGGRCGIVLDEGVLFRTNETAFVQTKRKLLDDCDLWCIVSLPGGVFSTAGAGVKTNLLFFTKGKPTERIWYYDLSHVKVGKTAPMTLERFAEFFRLLPDRADSEHSWTVDIAARRREAQQQAAPFHASARERTSEAALLREQIKALKAKKDPEQEEAIRALTEQVGTLESEARELRGKAEAIEDAAFDLKAVNPNVKANEEQRTPEELLDFIAEKGREADAALERLRQLLATA